MTTRANQYEQATEDYRKALVALLQAVKWADQATLDKRIADAESVVKRWQ